MGQERGGWGLSLADSDIGKVCYTDKRAHITPPHSPSVSPSVSLRPARADSQLWTPSVMVLRGESKKGEMYDLRARVLCARLCLYTL